jgi:phage gpG-like protein
MLISIQVTGTQKIIDKFNHLDDKIKDFSPEFKTLGEYLKGYFSGEAFLSKGSVYNQPWPEIKSFSKDRLSPLVVTGKMKDSFTFKADGNSLTVGNSTDYFKYHQSSRPRRVLPRRVMIGVNDTIKSKIKEEINNSLKRILNG